MWEDFENSLTWFAAAPSRWASSAKEDVTAAAEWILVVLEGDFAEEQTTAQIATGTVISMIPFVDQLCDIRDLIANCKKIKEDSSNNWAWLALAITLLGLFPVLGSLGKGIFKVLMAKVAKTFRGAQRSMAEHAWDYAKPALEQGIVKLNAFLARPAVAKTLKTLKWHNPYRQTATLLRQLGDKVSTSALTQVFDELIVATKKLTDLVQKWGTAAMATRAGQLLATVKGVRDQANSKLGEVVAPLQNYLKLTARRLEIEADMNYRAYTKSLNPHAFAKPSLDAEIGVIKGERPKWVDVKAREPYKALDRSPAIPPGYPNVAAKSGPLTEKFNTFHTMAPMEIPPGTTIYRVLDPASSDNSICWMSKAEFDKLQSKDDWRRRFAVWANWNNNGEFVTYTVPPGKPLKVWEGVTGTQVLKDAQGQVVKAGAGNQMYVLEGGARQIVLDPADLEKSRLGKRQATGWGYGNFGETPSMVGVPTLANNWYEAKK